MFTDEGERKSHHKLPTLTLPVRRHAAHRPASIAPCFRASALPAYQGDSRFLRFPKYPNLLDGVQNQVITVNFNELL